ncbi:hypothetical protein [Mesorhizobium captivum]|uniref:hypothetical protein n=1 Tax=Mesorhizobium captivum TaxID=3072319 RepID=UPI002A23D223|nr:hypothetical protein [Mesorhizobium sp. VK22B]
MAQECPPVGEVHRSEVVVLLAIAIALLAIAGLRQAVVREPPAKRLADALGTGAA